MSVVPKLRFEEFQEDWKLKRFSEIATFSKGKGISKADIIEGGKTPCIRYGELYTEYSEVIDDVASYTNVNTSSLKLSQGNEVIIPASGEVAWDIATASCVIQSGVALGGDLNILRTNENGEFIARYVSGKLKPSVARLAQGNSVVHVYGEQISGVHLRTPTLPEQKKIADFLGAVDEKIAGLRERERLLTQYKKGVMQKIFTQTLRFKADDGSDFPDWESKRLGDVTEFLKGKGIAKADIVENGKYECIRYGEIYTRYTEVISEIHSKTDAPKTKLVLSHANDVIIPASGEDRLDMARACHVSVEGVILGGDINILRGDTNGTFLAYYLNNAKKKEIARYAQGNSVVHLYGTQLKLLDISIPYPDEQQKIADFLSAIDDKITAVSAQISQMQDFKKGLLQQMFV